jgi:hypothetical protein
MDNLQRADDDDYLVSTYIITLVHRVYELFVSSEQEVKRQILKPIFYSLYRFLKVIAKYWSYWLAKISISGKTLEFVESADYPTEVNPDSLKYDYAIYYRQ